MEHTGPDHEPARHDDLAEPAAVTAAQAWWRQPATVLPIVIAVGALILALFSYWDQHQADRQQSAVIRQDVAAAAAAAAARREADAELVSYYPQPGNPKVVVVQNLSQHPVYGTSLHGLLAISGRHPLSILFPIWLGELPPCTDAQVDLQDPEAMSRLAAAAIGPSVNLATASWQWQTTAVTFNDGNDLTWVLATPGGKPSLSGAFEGLPVELGPVPPMLLRVAAGCS